MNTTKDAYCRLCAKLKPLKKLTNLQTNEEMCLEIVNKLSRFNIQLYESVLPKTVCLVCTKSLDQAFAIIIAIEQAQEALSNFILVQVNNDLNVENDESPHKNKVVIEIKSEVNVDSQIIVKSEDYNSVVNRKTIVEPPDRDNISVKNETYDIPLELSYEGNIKSNTVRNIGEHNLDNEEDTNSEMSTNEEDDLTDKHKNISVNTHSIENKIAKKRARLKKISLSSEKNVNLEYSAEYINKQIERLAKLPLHYITMTWMDFNWKCSFCGTQFPNIYDLQKHGIECHSTCNPYQCTECNHKSIQLNRFIKHVTTHLRYLHYSCYICFKKFSSPLEARKHKKTHKNYDHICLGCNYTFPNQDELNKHVDSYYSFVGKNVPEKLPNGMYKCGVCSKTYWELNSIKYHQNTHMDGKRNNVCEICGKGFYDKRSLKDHMIVHSDERPYQCEICKTSFKTAHRLRDHAQLHSGIKPFTCNECGKCFRRKSQLQYHKIIHSDLMPYSCTYCDKKFRTKTNLQNHLPQHTGVKAYSCDVCSRDFMNLANRNKHMKRKHGIIKSKKRPNTAEPASGGIISPEMKTV